MSIPKPSSRVKSVLHACTAIVQGSKHGEDDDGMPISETIEITMTIQVLELNYGPCLDWTLTVDVPCEKGWIWDDHPLLLCRARKSEDNEEPVSKVGEILDDTPAVRAMLAELCNPEPKKLYTGTDCTHRARLIAALELMWS